MIANKREYQITQEAAARFEAAIVVLTRELDTLERELAMKRLCLDAAKSQHEDLLEEMRVYAATRHAGAPQL